MSVDGQVLGASTIAGGGAAVVSTLTNTGTPQLVGIVVAATTLIVLALVTRAASRR